MTEVQFKPLNSNVLVQLIEKPVSDGGILLPNADKHPIAFGAVLDIGENVLNVFGNEIPINIKKGDMVYFLKHMGLEIVPLSGKFLVEYKNLIGKAA